MAQKAAQNGKQKTSKTKSSTSPISKQNITSNKEGKLIQRIRKSNKLLLVVLLGVLVLLGYSIYSVYQLKTGTVDSNASSSIYTLQKCGDISRPSACVDGSVEALIYRMYKTGYNVDPDNSGFNYWVEHITKGSQSPNSLAAEIIKGMNIKTSNTLTQVEYTNTEFVQAAYVRILQRQPDAGGKAYWIDRLNRRDITRDGVIQFFAQTAKITVAQAKTRLGSTTHTRTSQDTDASYKSFITTIYKNALGRSVDKGGLDYWVGQLKSNQSYASVLYTFASQPETVDKQRSSFTAYIKNNPPKYTNNNTNNNNNNNSNNNNNNSNNNNASDSPYICNAPYPTLKQNTKDNSNNRKDKCVSAVQYAIKNGAGQKLSINGTMDKATIAGLKNVQRFFKMPATGILTPSDMKTLNSIWTFKTDSNHKPDDGGNSGGNQATGDDVKREEGFDRSKLKIVVIGAGFSSDADRANFSRVSSDIISRIKSTNPFAKYSEDINFATISASDFLGCSANHAGIARLVQCDEADLLTLVTKAGILPDKKIVVVNDPGYGGAAGINGSTATTLLKSAEGVAIHELGHSFGLADEYLYSPYEQGVYAGLRVNGSEPYRQCASAEPPADWHTASGQWEFFQNISGINQWYRGCSFGDYYRSIEDGIMININSISYGASGEAIISKSIESITRR